MLLWKLEHPSAFSCEFYLSIGFVVQVESIDQLPLLLLLRIKNFNKLLVCFVALQPPICKSLDLLPVHRTKISLIMKCDIGSSLYFDCYCSNWHHKLPQNFYMHGHCNFSKIESRMYVPHFWS